MTEVEIDLAASDIYDSVKTFLTYCPDGSPGEAIRGAMDYVKGKYTEMNDAEYRKLNSLARQSYNDLTRSTGAKIHKNHGGRGNPPGKRTVTNGRGKIIGRQG